HTAAGGLASSAKDKLKNKPIQNAMAKDAKRQPQLRRFIFFLPLLLVIRIFLNRVWTLLSGSYPNDLFYRSHKYLPVADLTGSGGLGNDFNDLGDFVIRHKNLNLDLWQEIDRVFGTPIELRLPFLAPKRFAFRYGHPLNTRFSQRPLDFLQFERFDDRFNHLHNKTPLVPRYCVWLLGTIFYDFSPWDKPKHYRLSVRVFFWLNKID